MKRPLALALLILVTSAPAFAADSTVHDGRDPIAIIGIAATLIVSIATLIHTLQNDRRASFVNTVTSSRLRWIDSLRDEVAEFIATTNRLVSRRESGLHEGKTDELLLQRDTLEHQIALHLNPEDPQDQKIKTLAESVCQLTDSGGTASEISVTLNQLRDATAAYLKKEWNRVKEESVGGVRS
jgi:hypothetical protein